MLDNKNVLVFGLGISGVSTIKALANYKCNIVAYDSKPKDKLEGILEEIKDIKYDLVLDNLNLEDIDLIIKSPGIPPTNDVIIRALELNIEIITDLELGYILSRTKNILAITGTNGKTSTTTLVADMVKCKFNNTFICGNIGIGILGAVEKAEENDALVIECSSFQLENTSRFRPRVSTIINLKPDHLDWHGDYENYMNSKIKIFKNQTASDFSIINVDDEDIRKIEGELISKKIYISTQRKLEDGIYLEDGNIVYKDMNEKIIVVNMDDVDIFPENALIAVGFGIALGVDLEEIRFALEKFKSLPHRMEYVGEIDGVKYYNDSKGTNPDSTIKAIENTADNIILIAGGYDKGSDFEEMLEIGKDKIKTIILLGETKEKIRRQALGLDYKKIYMVNTMEEAVEKALEVGEKNDNVLLSPACASWGMYHNFEERGNHFKKIVNENMVR